METWLPSDIWTRVPPGAGSPGVDTYRVVVDPDLGAVAELTTRDGTRFYGADAPRHESPIHR